MMDHAGDSGVHGGLGIEDPILTDRFDRDNFSELLDDVSGSEELYLGFAFMDAVDEEDVFEDLRRQRIPSGVADNLPQV